MTMFPRRVRPRAREGDSSVRRRKRVKTFHTGEDQVIQEFQDILGHLRSNDIGRPPIPQYDGGMVEDSRRAVADAPIPLDDVLPEANLKSVPHDPSLQALWIAREIKKLAVYNERHNDYPRAGSMSTTSPVSPAFGLGATNAALLDHGEIRDDSMTSPRASGRRRRQTSKIKDSHFVGYDVDGRQLVLSEAYGHPMNGLDMLSALITNQRVQHALLYSVNLGPGNFEKRSTFGTLFLQSMAADTLPPDPIPAARLKHALWRSRNHVPYFAALHILAGFDEVVQAVEVAFQGRLDDSTPLTRREAPTYDYNQPSHQYHPNGNPRANIDADEHDFNRKERAEGLFPTRAKTAHRKTKLTKLPTPSRPLVFQGIAPRPTAYIEMAIPTPPVPTFKAVEPESDRDGSIPNGITGPSHFTPIDMNQSRKAIDALNGATAVLDEMAYGALKYSFLPQTSASPTKQYHTPYGPPGSNTYATPYTDQPTSQLQQVLPGVTEPQQGSTGSTLVRPVVAGTSTHHEGFFDHYEDSSGGHDMEQRIPVTTHKGKGKARESVSGSNRISESAETARNNVQPTSITAIASNREEGDEEDDFAQIDSFLALAAGDDSDSDDETDRDKTISREITPFAPFSRDTALESIIQGIVSELTTNQNRGHGIGFLTPQTHLYQINNAQGFAESLVRYFDDAKVGVNCLLSAEHSRALEALYYALIKRISNPYEDGTLPHYSNVVYHNGRAYQAIPGPAHPMYQQQLPYPPPPPPSSQMILPSQNFLPMTPQAGPARRASIQMPTSNEQPFRNVRESAVQRSAPPATWPQEQSRRSPENLQSRNSPRWRPLRPGNFRAHQNSEIEHPPIQFRSHSHLVKRKRFTG